MSYRLNLNFACILRHRETRELRYFRAVGQHGLFDSPIVISSRTDLKKLLIKLRNMNLNEFLLQQRPDTKWSVELVTNVLFSVYKSRFLLGAKEVEMPDYIRNNPSINCLTKNAKTGATYTDNLCLFRCLALHKGHDVRSVDIPARQLYQEWANFKGLGTTPLDFQGLDMNRDMHNFEDFYKINVEIYSLDLSGAAQIQYRSHNLHSETMYLNLHETHLSYIRNFHLYAKKYQCKFCKQLWNDYKEHKRHELRCQNKTKYVYPGGFYKPSHDVFHDLQDLDIEVAPQDRFFDYFIVFDFEAIQPPVSDLSSGNTVWESKHEPISVSVSSNVPEYESPECFVNLDKTQLIKDMLEYMGQIQKRSYNASQVKWGSQFKELKQRHKLLRDKEKKYQESKENGNQKTKCVFTKVDEYALKQLGSALGKLTSYMQQIPVLGFNSSKYDINLVKRELLVQLQMHQSNFHPFTVKRNNAYICISNEQFKFLDMTQFLSAGTSYAQFLSAYGIEEGKGHFPYSWFDDPNKLQYPKLPSKQCFYNSLKKQHISEEDYQTCLKVWRKEGMKTFQDFLIWYNNLDVGPFVKAVCIF